LNRKTSVTYFVGRGTELPMIRLRGRWLAAAGFARGARVAVTVAQGRLTLELAGAAAEVSEAPAAPYALPGDGG
jgi:hypothetical protein